jgi:hypothetical protein
MCGECMYIVISCSTTHMRIARCLHGVSVAHAAGGDQGCLRTHTMTRSGNYVWRVHVHRHFMQHHTHAHCTLLTRCFSCTCSWGQSRVPENSHHDAIRQLPHHNRLWRWPHRVELHVTEKWLLLLKQSSETAGVSVSESANTQTAGCNVHVREAHAVP